MNSTCFYKGHLLLGAGQAKAFMQAVSNVVHFGQFVLLGGQ